VLCDISSMKTIKINEKERLVLNDLAEAYHPDEWRAFHFKGLIDEAKGLDLKSVRRACRSLARKGLAKYERSLWSDDGPAGAGYRATEEGATLVSPCDICSKRATYDYHVDDDGNWSFKGRRVRECEEHHEQSAKKPNQLAIISLKDGAKPREVV
jgi:hypothetical protein